MNQLELIKEQIQMIQEEMDTYEREYQYHTEKANKAKEKGNELYEQQEKLEKERKILEMTDITKDEIEKVKSQLNQLRRVVNSDIINQVLIFVMGFSLSPCEEREWKEEEKDIYLRELHILFVGTEVTENGLNLQITMKTNRTVVKDLIHESMNIELDDDNWYDWNKEKYPNTKLMKEV
jgi:hypothetical protein